MMASDSGGLSQRVKGVLACISFIFFGVTSTLCITASEVDKKLPYNTTSANLLTEVVKFLVVFAWWFFEERSNSAKKNEGCGPALRFPTFTAQSFVMYSIPGFMYAIQNQLLYYAVFHLQPAMFQLASKLKFVSTAILHRVVLKRTLTMLQWLGIVTLVLGMTVSKGAMISPQCRSATLKQEGRDEPDGHVGKSLSTGLLIVVTTSTISGVSGIANEYLLKKVDESASFMLKNMQLYLWGVFFNILGALWETSGESKNFFHGFSMWTWIVILLKSAEGVSIAFIMRYLDNIVKCFASAILVYVTTLCSHILFNEAVDFFFILGLAVVTVALILYFGPHNEVLKAHEAAASLTTKESPTPWGKIAALSAGTAFVALLAWEMMKDRLGFNFFAQSHL